MLTWLVLAGRLGVCAGILYGLVRFHPMPALWRLWCLLFGPMLLVYCVASIVPLYAVVPMLAPATCTSLQAPIILVALNVGIWGALIVTWRTP
jgi:hypothetical protein